jgi:hypothetical protein
MDEEIVAKEKDTNQLKNLNRWLLALVGFIIIWSVGIFVYVDQKAETPKPPIPVIMVDPATGKVTNVAHAKIVPPAFVSTPKTTNEIGNPMFEQRGSYEKMDFVIINYFFIAGLVVDRQGDNYTIMYKDYNRVLQRIIVPKELLLFPTSANGVNPASLLAP